MQDQDTEQGEGPDEGRGGQQLNTVISLLVAASATFMALCNVKDGNVVQAMAQAQSNRVDAWNHYQAKSMKQHLAEASLDELTLAREPADEAARAQRSQRLAAYRAQVERYEREKAELKQKAEGHAREYAELNIHDDQFDIAEAALSISIAFYGLTALVRARWLLAVALLFSAVGSLFGLAGFLTWGLHPEWLARIFS